MGLVRVQYKFFRSILTVLTRHRFLLSPSFVTEHNILDQKTERNFCVWKFVFARTRLTLWPCMHHMTHKTILNMPLAPLWIQTSQPTRSTAHGCACMLLTSPALRFASATRCSAMHVMDGSVCVPALSVYWCSRCLHNWTWCVCVRAPNNCRTPYTYSERDCIHTFDECALCVGAKRQRVGIGMNGRNESLLSNTDVAIA